MTDIPTLQEWLQHPRPYGSPGDYQPKHLRQNDDRTGHCCFSGCIPMGCDGGCCANMGGHKASCSASPYRQYEDTMDTLYIQQGLPQHLMRITPPLNQRHRRRCGCGDVARYPERLRPQRLLQQASVMEPSDNEPFVASNVPCAVCNGTGLAYDRTECRMVPCGGICCMTKEKS